jgi:hypothetical protein
MHAIAHTGLHAQIELALVNRDRSDKGRMRHFRENRLRHPNADQDYNQESADYEGR